MKPFLAAILFGVASSANAVNPDVLRAFDLAKNGDDLAAYQIVEPLCVGGDVSACELAVSYYIKLPDETYSQRTDREKRLSRIGCDFGAPQLCFQYAVSTASLNSYSTTQEDLEEARVYYKRGCDDRHPESCLNLSVYQRYGFGGEVNRQDALINSAIACADDRTGKACMMNAQLSLEVVPKDYSTALSGYAMACEEMGRFEACAHYGNLLLDPALPERDPVKGMKLLDEACDDQLLGEACAMKGYHLEAMGLADEADRLTQKGCEIDAVTGCLYRGKLLSSRGLLADARDVWMKSCELGGSASCAHVVTLLRANPPSDRSPANTAYMLKSALQEACRLKEPIDCSGL